jgi:hypothetical protein
MDRLFEFYSIKTIDNTKLDAVLMVFEDLAMDGEISKKNGRRRHASAKSVSNVSEDVLTPTLKVVMMNNTFSPLDGNNTHAFLPLIDASKYCEYCYERSSKPNDDLYRCESKNLILLGCNIICHKNCRNLLKLLCKKTSEQSDSNGKDVILQLK